jgi:hypothetical protein
MTDAKQPGAAVFRVVDKSGARHVIRADRMVTDGDTVKFIRGGLYEVASFQDPIGAMRVEDTTSVGLVGLAPGEACLSAFQPVPRGLMWASWLMALVILASVSLRAYEVFWLAG